MLIKLTGKRWINHSYHKQECDVSRSECSKKECLHPHDFGYRLGDGTYRKRIMCLTREQGGCK